MEVAAYLSDKAASVSSIDITAVPFERVLGEPVGKMLQEVSHALKHTYSTLNLLIDARRERSQVLPERRSEGDSGRGGEGVWGDLAVW